MAARDIAPLEIILQDKAAVVAPEQDDVCLECLKDLQVPLLVRGVV